MGDALPPAALGDCLLEAVWLLRRVRAGRGALAAYARTALSATTASTSPHRSLFPMAPPYAWAMDDAPSDSAGRIAWRWSRAVDLFVNVLVLALSHLALGGARRCGVRAHHRRSGAR